VRDAEAALTRAERAVRQRAEERAERVRDAAAVAVGPGARAVRRRRRRRHRGERLAHALDQRPVRDLVRGMAAVAAGASTTGSASRRRAPTSSARWP
jgi:hypothetical protein